MKLMGETSPPELPMRVYKIASIASSLNTTEVRGLCGGAFSAKFGSSDVDLLASLKNQPACKSLVTYDTTGNGRVSFVYFPEDRLRLGFGDEELIQAAVYAPVNEVQ
jgi:hypothetical protein